jgi:hypothetical protein
MYARSAAREDGVDIFWIYITYTASVLHPPRRNIHWTTHLKCFSPSRVEFAREVRTVQRGKVDSRVQEEQIDGHQNALMAAASVELPPCSDAPFFAVLRLSKIDAIS